MLKIENLCFSVNENGQNKEILENIFDSFNIDILHVHHFLFQTFDAIDVAKARNIYSIITLHDLYMICPSINMVYKDKYCEYDEKKDCAKCLKIRYGVNSNILNNWQKTCQRVLEKFDKRIIKSREKSISISSRYLTGNIKKFMNNVKIIINK